MYESQFRKLYKEDRPSCSVVMKTSVGIVYLLTCLLEPFMPSFSLEVLKRLNLPLETQFSLSDEKSPLFRELGNVEVEFFREKFAGSQADRIVKAEAEAKKLADKLKGTNVSEPEPVEEKQPKGSIDKGENLAF
ncbi:unnamed protein product [Fraxinus pennsylvanica]|uniref:Methionyl-tRNA synthetase n=1 Tax=Fraxinus pennsylvanica TaxID=56036 RepID=A0AAD2AC84_9LAMI|nr:unnamed protein product [Fraxinus pennsylvanica]